METTRVEDDGIPGDRIVHAVQGDGRVVTSRFRPGLLALSATIDASGEALVDGLAWDAPETLARVRAATSPDVDLVRFTGADHGQRFDVLPLTVLTDGMAAALGYDHRRFRPNVLIAGVDGLEETTWPGRFLRIGGLVIGIRNRRSRCVMTTFDPDTQAQDGNVLLRVVREFEGRVALDCWVEAPGSVSVGDPVELL